MKTVEFFFDLSSPYSYLASTRIDALAARVGAELRWRPFVLGAVFKATGNVMPASNPAKARYMFDDLHRWARRYGVPFRFTSRFPVNALRTERLILVAERAAAARGPALARAAFHALWVDDRDITDDAVLAELAAGAGLDPAAALPAIDAPEIKQKLRDQTDEAVRRGAFGAPTFFVGDQLYVGNDRLDFVAEALQDAP